MHVTKNPPTAYIDRSTIGRWLFEGGEGGQEGEAGSRKQRIGPGSTRARRGQASFRAAKGRCRASHEPDYIGISFREPVVVDSLKRIRF